MENVRKLRDIKFVTAERRSNYSDSGPNYHTTKFFTEHLLAIEIKKKKKKKKKKKQKYLCFIVYIKTDDIYKDIAKDVETRSKTSNYGLERLLPKGKNKKVLGLMKDKLVGKIMIKFVKLLNG